MKKIALLILITLITVQVAAQSRVMARREIIDLGPVIWKTKATTEFTLTNKGNEPLTIDSVEASCECAAIAWSQEPAGYNQSHKIKVEFDAKLLGQFNKQILVYNNSQRNPITLTLKGNVVASTSTTSTSGYPYKMGTIRVDKKSLNFEEVNKGEMAEVILSVRNIGTTSYSPEIMHLPSYITAQYEPERILPGETGKIVLFLDSEQLTSLGEISSKVYISRFLGDVVEEINSITLSATLLPNLNNLTYEQLNNPPQLFLSANELKLNYQEKKQRSQTITLENRGKSPLEISAVQPSSTTIGVGLNKRIIKPGGKSKLKVTLQEPVELTVNRKPQVLLITNEPDHQKIVIPIHTADTPTTLPIKHLIGTVEELGGSAQ